MNSITTRTPTIDVIVVLWKSLPFLDGLFRSFADVDYPREAVTVHIVDNASPDGAGAEVKRRLTQPDPRWPRIVLHEPGSNTGFSAGNNIVMRASHADYCYLLNADAVMTPATLREAVAVAEAHPDAAAVQSLLLLMQKPDTLNSSGNAIHIAGFGFSDGYLEPATPAPTEVRPIAYASGAAVLYRTSVLKKIGVLDEALFLYHEDLELGWRMWLAGYTVLLAPKSVALHHYEFSRSIAKWYWMERNRWIVILTYYRFGTLLLLAPALCAIELMVWLTSFIGGWAREKMRVTAWFLRPSSWIFLWQMRRRIQALRVRSDRDILTRFVAVITHQDGTNRFVERVANPLMRIYFSAVKALVRW
ncbi:MAG: hypothetical protein RL141_938 [Candidatus Parcubacteria bacterium]|jgi:GT2 family glycosyltransferase